MSRIVNVGAGDISDRLTILALKIFYGQVGGKNTKHWEQERAVLLTQIRAKTLNGVWFEQVLELGAVNAALWTATDQLRDLKDGHRGGEEARGSLRPWERLGAKYAHLYRERAVLLTQIRAKTLAHQDRELDEAGQLGIQILQWNDHRAELVNAINKLAGDQLGSEKGKD